MQEPSSLPTCLCSLCLSLGLHGFPRGDKSTNNREERHLQAPSPWLPELGLLTRWPPGDRSPPVVLSSWHQSAILFPSRCAKSFWLDVRHERTEITKAEQVHLRLFDSFDSVWLMAEATQRKAFIIRVIWQRAVCAHRNRDARWLRPCGFEKETKSTTKKKRKKVELLAVCYFLLLFTLMSFEVNVCQMSK